MGTFNWAMEIRSADGQRVETVEALVDTGPRYTILPVETLRRLGILPTSTRQFEFGDGRIIKLDIGEARIRLGGEEHTREEHTRIVVFGTDPASYILRADTLQGAGLVVDTMNHRLIPTNSLLKPAP